MADSQTSSHFVTEVSFVRYSKLVVMLGAGASVMAGVPAFAQYWPMMIDHFKLGNDQYAETLAIDARGWECLHKIVRGLLKSDPEFVNFEKLCQDIRHHQVELVNSLRMHVGDWQDVLNEFLHLKTLANVEYSIRKHFLTAIDQDFNVTLRGTNENHRQYLKFFDLMKWGNGTLDIFTLNNDLLVEWLCRHKKIQLADGFVQDGNFDHSCYANLSTGIRLYKLHGSINWQAPGLSTKNVRKTLASQSVIGKIFPGHIASKAADTPLIWPGIYEEYDGHLGELRSIHLFNAVSAAKLILIVGYRLGDPEILKTISDALDANHQATVVVANREQPILDKEPSLAKLKLRFEERIEFLDKASFPRILEDSSFMNYLASQLG